MAEWIPTPTLKNYVLIGEAGCGKSELAINLAAKLRGRGKEVHLFDLDMTKPLFRTRDAVSKLSDLGVTLHFEEQFMDAPTVTGGVRRCLSDENCDTVLDVGGDSIGARAIGAYAPMLNRAETSIWYIINPFRPWSATVSWIDRVLSEILYVSHIQFHKLCLVANPNFGESTTEADILSGLEVLKAQLADAWNISILALETRWKNKIEKQTDIPLFPIERYLSYPW